MPEIVQEIGAYAGLASVVGLAVLSVLYFSQARDVKRLREWAGRAPERAEQGTAVTQPTPGRVVAQPQAQPQAQQRPPAAKAPAVPAATGARPAAAPAAAAAAQDKQPQPAAAPAAAGAAAAAAAKPTAATAQSGQQNAPAAPQQQPASAPSAPQQQPASAPTALKEGAPPPAQPQPAPGSGQPAAAPAGAQGAPSGTPAKAGAPPVPGAPRPAAGAAAGGRQGGPPLPPAPARPAGRPAPQQTQVIPPKRESWHQRIFGSTRNLILAIGGVLLLGAGVALALTQLSGDESEPPPASQAQQQQPQAEENDGGEDNGEAQRPNRPAIEPSSVTVAVLNGTTVPGLAARVSDEVQSAGFEVGTVANSSDQQRAESVILFSPGHEREAAAVSRRLDIAQREPIDAATQGLAGDATVVVVTGADRS